MDTVSKHLHPVYLEDFNALKAIPGLDALRKSRWLITGATGLVPAYLVRFLAWLNEEQSLDLDLFLWVRSVEKAHRLFPWWKDKGMAVEIGVPDWQNPGGWTLPEVDYAVHAASPATPAACRADPKGVMACNIAGTQALLERLDPRVLRGFLYFSSSEVYGDTDGLEFPDEEQTGRLDPDASRSLYPLAKLAGEALCHDAFRRRHLPVRIARIFHTYGPGMDLERDGRVFADFVGNLIRGEDILMKSDGSARRAFCYLGDTVEALLTILLRGKDDACYNIGNPQGILSVSELADLLLGMAPGSGLKKVMLPGHIAQSPSSGVFPNVSRLEKLGWTSKTSPGEGFHRTIQSYLP